jgi:Sulfotransferase family
MKAGTTSLFSYLQEHPEIGMSSLKETNFFAGPPEGVAYPRGTRRIQRLEDYERLFDPRFRVRGEASPTYTVYPQHRGVPERIKVAIPDAKLIYIVRDPVARALSHYHHSVSLDGERRTLSEALSDYPPRPMTSAGFYAMQLEQFLPYFLQDQILVVDNADLLSNRQDALRDIFRFLSVDDSFVSAQFAERLNTGTERRTYSKLIIPYRWIGRPVLQRLPPRLRQTVRWSAERLLTRPLEPQSGDDSQLDQLRDLYAPDATRLRELTGKTFATWSV